MNTVDHKSSHFTVIGMEFVMSCYWHLKFTDSISVTDGRLLDNWGSGK